MNAETTEDRCYLQEHDRRFLTEQLRRASATEGVFAEVGVYRGGTARLLCQAKGSRALYLFDTFAGLPEDGEKHRRGQYAYPQEDVEAFLGGYAGLHFVKGAFPRTCNVTARERFAFVHVDTDLYAGTLTALAFFAPRLVRHGRILVHDAGWIKEVGRAVDDAWCLLSCDERYRFARRKAEKSSYVMIKRTA